MDKLASGLIKGSSYIMISSFFVRGLRVIKSIIIARFLGPENLGMYSILVSLNGLQGTFAEFGNSFALTNMIGKYKIHNRKEISNIISSVVWFVLASTLLTTLIVILISGYLATEVYSKPELQFYIVLLSLFLFLTIISGINTAILQGYHKMREIAILSVLATLLGISILYPLARYYGLLGVILSGIISGMLFVLIAIVFFIKKIFEEEEIVLYFRLKKEVVRESLKTSLPNFSQTAVDMASPLIAGTLLVIMLGFEKLGYYHVAGYFTWIVLSIPLAIATPYYPMINELYSSRSKDYSRFIMKSQKLVCFSALPIALGMGLFSNLFISGLYGGEYSLAINVAYWTSITAFFAAFSTLFGYIFYVQMRGFEMVKIRIIWLLIYIVSAYFLIQQFDVMGMGMAYFVAYAGQSIIFLKMLPPNIQFNRWKTAILLLLLVVGVILIFFMWVQLERSKIFSIFIVLAILLLEYKALTMGEQNMLMDNFKKLRHHLHIIKRKEQ